MIVKVQIIIPVYHPDDKLMQLLESLHSQKDAFYGVCILDSGSDKQYMTYENKLPHFYVQEVNPNTFDHGGTRRLAAEQNYDADILIYMTQDAVPADEHAIANLIHAFENSHVGCAYGRQLPDKNASLMSEHARLFNYGKESYVRGQEDVIDYGMKTVFMSDSFAAYRTSALKQVGSFPKHANVSEDMYVAAKMVKAGWQVAYRADAKVYHSHNYTIWREFCRYFDIGVFHGREAWIRREFGKAEGEGKRFVVSEIKYLCGYNPLLLIPMTLRNGMKFIGYRLGIWEKYIPLWIKKKISMTKVFWDNEG